MKFNLIEELENYHPGNEKEKEYVERTLRFLKTNSNCFSRENLNGHITAGALVIDENGNVLLNHHKILNKWVHFGGHSDGEGNSLNVAKREVMEESGIIDFNDWGGKIFDVDVHSIPENISKKEPEHYHYDIRFLFIVKNKDFVISDESIEIKWVSIKQAKLIVKDKSMLRMLDKADKVLTEMKKEKQIKSNGGRKMKNNYFIIHGSFGSPFGNWFSWLYDFISSDGNQVYVPQFPIGVGYQNYDNWSKLFKYYLELGLINENTIIVAHSIAPVFVSKFLTENKVKVNKLIFVCGFNNYLGIDEEYDTVNKTMYFDNLQEVKQYANEIICFYSDNDPYVKFEVEEEFADTIATEQICIPNAGHINSESGFDTFEEIVSYL